MLVAASHRTVVSEFEMHFFLMTFEIFGIHEPFVAAGDIACIWAFVFWRVHAFDMMARHALVQVAV